MSNEECQLPADERSHSQNPAIQLSARPPNTLSKSGQAIKKLRLRTAAASYGSYDVVRWKRVRAFRRASARIPHFLCRGLRESVLLLVVIPCDDAAGESNRRHNLEPRQPPLRSKFLKKFRNPAASLSSSSLITCAKSTSDDSFRTSGGASFSTNWDGEIPLVLRVHETFRARRPEHRAGPTALVRPGWFR